MTTNAANHLQDEPERTSLHRNSNTVLDRNNARWLTAAMTMAAAIYSLTLTYPFNNDNALYAYMADLLLRGRLPYIGSWDQNFPGILLVQIVPLLLGLRSQFAFHVWDILLQLMGCWFLFQIVLKVANSRAAFLAVALSAMYYVQQGLWMSGERDTYVTIMVFVCIWIAIARPVTLGWISTIAILLGVIFLFRPTYGLYIPCFALWVFLNDSASSSRNRRVQLAFAVLLVSAVPTLVVILVYIVAGGFHDLWLSTIVYNFKVYGGAGDQFAFWDPIRFYAGSILFVLFGIWILRRKDSRGFLLLWALLFCASLVSLVLLYRHSVYHYHPMMALFILLSAVGWEAASRRFAGLIHTGTDARAGMSIAGIALLLLFFGYQTFRGNTIQSVVIGFVRGDLRTTQQIYGAYEGSPMFGEQVQTEVGEYLKAHTERGDAIQMFGPYSYPQYYARLSTASRFQTLHAIAMRGSGDSLQPFQREWRQEYLRDMQVTKPVYFIVCDAPEAFRQYYGGMLGHEILNKDFTELRDEIRRSYHFESKIGAFTLYRRN